MQHVVEIDTTEEYTLPAPQQFLLLECYDDTYAGAVTKAANLISDIQDAVAMETLNLSDTTPTVLWRRRPLLTSVADLTQDKRRYVVRFALATIPAIDIASVASKQPEPPTPEQLDLFSQEQAV